MKTTSLEFAQLAIEWDCPYVLHWQLYDNEFENGEYNGFWLIDNHGTKQPFFHALENYYSSARSYVSAHAAKKGTAPKSEPFQSKAIKALEKIK